MFWIGVIMCLFADAIVLTTSSCPNKCADTICPKEDSAYCHNSHCVCKRHTGVCHDNNDCKYGHCDEPICDTSSHHCQCGHLPHDHKACSSNSDCSSIHCGHGHHGHVCNNRKCYCTETFEPKECGHHHHHHDETCPSNSCNSPYSPLCGSSLKCSCIRSPLECTDNSNCKSHNCSANQEPTCANTRCTCVASHHECTDNSNCKSHSCSGNQEPTCVNTRCTCVARVHSHHECTNNSDCKSHNCSANQEPTCVNTSCKCVDKMSCIAQNDCGDLNCNFGQPVCHHHLCTCENLKPSVHCKSGWTKFGDNCYHLVPTKVSWVDAFKACHDLGSGLVDIGSSEENLFVQKLANGSLVWIAASDSIKEGTWQWFGSNQLFNYTHWGHGQPDNAGGQDCAILQKNANWDDRSCSETISFICEQANPVSACSSDWTKSNGKCYKLFSTRATWLDALAHCQTHSATLVNIENSNENSLVRGLLHTKEDIWIGGFDGAAEGTWEWVGGDFPWNYTNWRSGQPNNFGGREDCNSMFASDGMWHDSNCGSQQHFICEKADPPVDGGWSDFGSYGHCSVSCGESTRTRSRTCTNPAPQNGGKNCTGSSTETESCHKHPCPINGGWSDFGSYDNCSVSCGGGNKTRSRTCTNPTPQHGGKDCVGSSTEIQSCNTDPCPTVATSGSPCPTCDESLNCVWGRVCPDSQTCMIRSFPNYKFSVHCSISDDCHFIKSVLSTGEIFCCDDKQCLSDTLGI